LELRSKTEVGQQILEENTVFWVLYSYYVKDKLEKSIDDKEKVRRQIVDYFFQSEDKKAEQSYLKKHLDDLLYLPEEKEEVMPFFVEPIK
jgi:hypothetical protein